MQLNSRTVGEYADWALFDDQLTPVTIARVMQGYANDNTSWLGSPKNPKMHRCRNNSRKDVT